MTTHSNPTEKPEPSVPNRVSFDRFHLCIDEWISLRIIAATATAADAVRLLSRTGKMQQQHPEKQQ
jgi:hypothetical protein